MIEQLKTIREALVLGIKAINHLGGAREAMPLHDAMPALTQLEAMVGEQEPQRCDDCGDTVPKRKCYCRAGCVHEATPVAQQYEAADMASAAAQGFRDGVASVVHQPQKLEDVEQYRLQMAGISTAAIGYWKDGDPIHPDYDTPALRDVAKLYAKYDALYKAQQPQADTPQATTIAEAARDVGKWLNERPNRPIDLRHVAMLVAHAMQPQAEAVQYTRADLDRAYSAGLVEGERLAIQQAEQAPPGYVLVPVVPDETWAYQVIRRHQPNLDVGCKAWLGCLEELLYWHAAIAQHKSNESRPKTCPNKFRPDGTYGGCQLHNLHCAYPNCEK